MKILLVEPTKPTLAIGGDEVFIYEPLALEYIGAGVSSEHVVKILDLRLEKDFGQVLNEYKRKRKNDFSRL